MPQPVGYSKSPGSGGKTVTPQKQLCSITMFARRKLHSMTTEEYHEHIGVDRHQLDLQEKFNEVQYMRALPSRDMLT